MTKFIHLYLDDGIHEAFKMHCRASGTSMQVRLTQMVCGVSGIGPVEPAPLYPVLDIPQAAGAVSKPNSLLMGAKAEELSRAMAGETIKLVNVKWKGKTRELTETEFVHLKGKGVLTDEDLILPEQL